MLSLVDKIPKSLRLVNPHDFFTRPHQFALKRKILIYLFNHLKNPLFQDISPIQCSNLMYFPLFLPLRTETRENCYLNAKLLFRRVIKPLAFESEIYPSHKPTVCTQNIRYLNQRLNCFFIICATISGARLVLSIFM